MKPDNWELLESKPIGVIGVMQHKFRMDLKEVYAVMYVNDYSNTPNPNGGCRVEVSLYGRDIKLPKIETYFYEKDIERSKECACTALRSAVLYKLTKCQNKTNSLLAAFNKLDMIIPVESFVVIFDKTDPLFGRAAIIDRYIPDQGYMVRLVAPDDAGNELQAKLYKAEDLRIVKITED